MDVTLRDGGLKISFDWPTQYAREHYQLGIDNAEVDYVELGYWKQSVKYHSPFFSIDETFLEEITLGNTTKACVMIDFHYCSKEMADYPNVASKGAPNLYRLTARKVDANQAVEFASILKGHTGARVSINFSNASNLTDYEVLDFSQQASSVGLDYVYFADSHGSLDLASKADTFRKSCKILKNGGVIPGIHLHDHSHLALENFKLSHDLGFAVTDVSFTGLGKGGGNLRLEDVMHSKYSLELANLWYKHKIQTDLLRGFYFFLSGRSSTVDHYADWAWESNVGPIEFNSLLLSLKDSQRDQIDLKFLDEYSPRFI